MCGGAILTDFIRIPLRSSSRRLTDELLFSDLSVYGDTVDGSKQKRKIDNSVSVGTDDADFEADFMRFEDDSEVGLIQLTDAKPFSSPLETAAPVCRKGAFLSVCLSVFQSFFLRKMREITKLISLQFANKGDFPPFLEDFFF